MTLRAPPIASLLAAAGLACLLSACGGSSPTATAIPTRDTLATRAGSPIPATPRPDLTRTTATPYGAFVTVTPFSADQPTFAVPTRALPSPRPGETIPPTFTPAPFVTVTPFPTARPGDSGPLPTPTLREPTLRPGETAPPTLRPFATVTPLPIETVTLSPAQLTQAAIPTNGGASRPDFSAPPPPPALNALFPEGCRAFTLDKAASKLFVLVKGEGLLAWGNVPEATGYHAWLLDPSGKVIVNAGVETNRLALPVADGGKVLFSAPGVYPFEIVAYRGTEPICPHITDIVVVSQ